MFQLAEEVARRLDAIDMRGRSLALKVMKRDPAAPVEPPKVSVISDLHNSQFRCNIWYTTNAHV